MEQELLTTRCGVADLDRVRAYGDRVVVVDVETTGLGPKARVVEVACVTVSKIGDIVDEWHTLVNPEGDVGPTHVHRIENNMVQAAPTFGSLAPLLGSLLDGAILAAHNLRFDQGMLHNDFARVGVPVAFGEGIDTLRLIPGKLQVAAQRLGVELRDAHSALGDARACAEMYVAYCRKVNVPIMPTTSKPVACVQPSTTTIDLVQRRVSESSHQGALFG